MQTEGGKGILYHCERKDILFNVRHGDYDVIVMQDKASNFSAEEFAQGMDTLAEKGLSQTDARRVLYMPWANPRQAMGAGRHDRSLPRCRPETQRPPSLPSVRSGTRCLSSIPASPSTAMTATMPRHWVRIWPPAQSSTPLPAVSRPLQPADDDALITRLELVPQPAGCSTKLSAPASKLFTHILRQQLNNFSRQKASRYPHTKDTGKLLFVFGAWALDQFCFDYSTTCQLCTAFSSSVWRSDEKVSSSVSGISTRILYLEK